MARPAGPAPLRSVPCPGIVMAAGLCLVLLVGCAKSPDTRGPGAAPPPLDTTPRAFRGGTPEMQAKLRQLVAEMEALEGAERLEHGARILQYGEPGIPVLRENLDHPDPGMRMVIVYLLGRYKDPRTYDDLDARLADAHEGVRYEAATALVRAGDARGMPALVDALVHRDPRARKRAIDELSRATGDTLGYRYDAHPHERRAAVSRWTRWLETRTAPRDP